MKNKLDEKVMNRFALALGAMTLVSSDDRTAANARRVMFMCGEVGHEGALDQISRDLGMDVVALGFRPGHERAGPANIAIHEERDGVLRSWTDCALWAHGDKGPFLVVGRTQEVCFCHDGVSLIFIADWPSAKSTKGIERAKVLLRRAAAKVPADLPTRRVV